jgi:hypothetical protein
VKNVGSKNHRIDSADWTNMRESKCEFQMVNSVKRLQDMKAFTRGKVEPWNCRAGQNSIIIRVDGTGSLLPHVHSNTRLGCY